MCVATCAFAHLRIASISCAAPRHVQLAVTRLDNHIITCSFSPDWLTTGPGRECLDVVKANGFDVEENPLGGLQLTAVPISKNTTFGVRPTMAAALAGVADQHDLDLVQLHSCGLCILGQSQALSMHC